MKKWDLKDKSKIIKISIVIAYIEVLTYIITSYMEKLEKWLDMDFGLNNIDFKLNAPIILLTNFKILLIFLFISFIIYLVIDNYKKVYKKC